GIERSSVGNCSHCRYEKGDTKSKYQSALGIARPTRSDCLAVSRPAVRQLGDERAPLFGGQPDPAGDLVERAVAAGTQTRWRIDHADAGAGRADLVGHGNGSLAFSARATRETGARPRKSETNWPAMRSRVMSTPVSMPRPSRR